MRFRIFSYIAFVIFVMNSYSQNMQILYDFDQLPQTLLLNPGAEVDYDHHFGVPLLSNSFIQIGATNSNVTYNNTLAISDNFPELVSNIYDQNLKRDDYFIFNQQIEVLNAGFRLRNPDYYLSFGMYQEAAGFATYPYDLANLYFNGDDIDGDGVPNYDTNFNFNSLNITSEVVGVYHVGISKKVNENLNLGVRLKLLSGSLNLNTVENTGDYHLEFENLMYQHIFNNMNFGINTSGLIDSMGDSVLDSSSDVISGLVFLNGNLGVGFDFGLTYHTSNDIILSASLLDLDYINYGNEVTTYQIEEEFVLEDSEYFNPPEGNEYDYWEDKLTEFYFDGKIPMDTVQVAYNTFRAPKVNLSAKYQFIRKPNPKKGNSAFRNVNCDYTMENCELVSEAGIQLYTAFQPDTYVWAATLFYSREFNRYLNAKVTYTYSDFSAKNFGIGLSTHYKTFNFYVTADNLLDLYKIKDTNYFTGQVGMNFIFD